MWQWPALWWSARRCDKLEVLRLRRAATDLRTAPKAYTYEPRNEVAVSYAVKEVFLTLQGEGAHAGRRAVFCRFTGCNLWSGQEADREDAQCRFCDTDFVGMDGTRGGRYAAADDLAAVIEDEWGQNKEGRWVVLTGGEPLLQVDAALIDALHRRGFAVAVETN